MIHVHNLDIKLGIFEIKNVNLRIARGEFLVLLGPSAAGKSVILESIAGLVPISKGKIVVNNRDVTYLKPEKRNISICYQDYNLFPHLSVRDNICYGLRFKKDKHRVKYSKNFKTLIKLLELEEILDRLPINLSGGEQQRVSLARGLVGNPDVLLLDEPLSSLDPNIKWTIQEELKTIHQTMGTTIIMVTHDFTEANYLADKVALIYNGEIVQQGTIEDIFQSPQSIFAAQFTGIKNIFWLSKDKELKSFGLKQPAYIGVRPENIYIHHRSLNTYYQYQGKINSFKNNGIYMEIELNTADRKRNYISYLTLNRFFELKLKKDIPIHFGFNKKDLIIVKP
jgi:ABC-type sugar transport system ATPase subunit